MTVLLSGFDPFNGETTNPAYQAIERLPDHIEGHRLIKLELPTVFGKSLAILKEAIRLHQPDIVICVGQAGGRYAVTPEVVAINLEEATIADNEGNVPMAKKIAEWGENAYFTKLPVKRMVQDMRAAGIPSQLSYSAGTYVCNHLFYGLMHYIETENRALRGGFIHVPYSHHQVVHKKNTASLSLDIIADALDIAIRTALNHRDDIKSVGGTTH